MNVLDVLLREGVRLEGLSHQGVVVGAELTFGWISFGQMFQLVCRDLVTLFVVCPGVLEPNLIKNSISVFQA